MTSSKCESIQLKKLESTLLTGSNKIKISKLHNFYHCRIKKDMILRNYRILEFGYLSGTQKMCHK